MSIAVYPNYESFKPTDVKWAPEAPDHWDVRPLSAVARIVSEANQPELELLSVYLGRGVIRFSDVDEKRTNATSTDLSKYQVVRPGDLVLNNQQAWRGSVGVSAHEGIVSPAYIVLDLGASFDPRFADYYFQTPTTVSHFLVSSKGVGTIQRNLYWPALKRCPIASPPLPEQRAIAAFLDEKCAKIDEAVRIEKEQIKLLRERKQILIQQAVTRGLNPDAPMKDSGIDWIGQIPAHWEMKRLRHATHISPSRRVDGHISRNDQVVFLPMEAIGVDGRITQLHTGSAKDLSEGLTYFQKGDVIMAKITPCFENGKAAFLDDLASEYGFGTTELHVLRPNAVTGKFLYYFINRSFFRARGEIFMVGSAGQKRVSTNYLKDQPIPIPPLGEQGKIVEFLDQEDTQIDNAISVKCDQIDTLKEYKTSLINEAVTGKIKVI